MGMSEQVGGDSANTLFLSIIGGNLAEKVEEGTLGAKRREYETSDGNKGVKFEIYHKNLTGVIAGMDFVDGTYGEQFILTLVNGEDQAKIHLNTDSKYFSAFAKKLPNVKLEDPIVLNSYDFETTDGKRLTGLDIKQAGIKLEDFYWDKEKKKPLNGMVEVNEDRKKKMGKDYWKSYFLDVKIFLKEEVQKVVLPIADTQPLDINDADDVFE